MISMPEDFIVNKCIHINEKLNYRLEYSKVILFCNKCGKVFDRISVEDYILRYGRMPK